MEDFFSGPGRTGLPAHIAARDNDPARVGDPHLLRALSILPWDQQPPPGSINFFLQERANLSLPGAAGSTVVTTIAGGGAVLIPQNNLAVITSAQLYCDAPSLTTSILYQVRQNGGFIPGLTMKFPPIASTFILFGQDGTWDLYSGGVLDVLITRVVADVASNVNFTLTGWYVPMQTARLWTGMYPGQIG